MADTTLSALIDKFLQETTLDATEQNSIREDLGLKTTDPVTFKNLILTALSLTGSQATSSIDIAATWNTSGTPTAFKLNVTDTASNAASLLMDLQVSGASKFKASKDGFAHMAYGAAVYTGTSTSGNRSILMFDPGSGGVIYTNKIFLAPSGGDVGAADLFLYRVADSTLQFGANHATTPTTQTIKAHDVTAGTGANLNISSGTGSVAKGGISINAGSSISLLTKFNESSQPYSGNIYTYGTLVPMNIEDSTSGDFNPQVGAIARGEYDAGLYKPIYWDGTQWVDMTGIPFVFYIA